MPPSGGYQVFEKRLSHCERAVLGRSLLPEEVLYFAEVARRIGAVLQARIHQSARVVIEAIRYGEAGRIQR